jgi:hypothetical protein
MKIILQNTAYKIQNQRGTHVLCFVSAEYNHFISLRLHNRHKKIKYEALYIANIFGRLFRTDWNKMQSYTVVSICIGAGLPYQLSQNKSLLYVHRDNDQSTIFITRLFFATA